jgi:CRISPR-associated endoribonuclease Cas6
MAVESVEILPRPEITENRIRIRTLSPIEVHSTLSKGDGSKKTYYYKPREREFGELVASNMAKKWEALYGEKCPYSLNMEPVRVEYLKSAVLKYKGFVIEGWKGHFWLEGEPEFLQFALDAGLGSRNSQGFGCVDRVLPREVSGVGNREFGKEGR